jgi:ubiquinone/menaquinone biosynthesis C-methylase UbiE
MMTHDAKRATEDSQETEEWTDETAAQYVEKYGKDPTNRMTVEAAGLAPDDVVVDVGCGGGEAVRVAAERAVRGSVIGVDPTPAMIRIATEQTRDHSCAARVCFLEGPAEKLPLESGSARVVLAINSLHHWDDPDLGLREVMRVLAPGGRFFIGDEETESGDWSHAEGELSDPAYLRLLVERHGFEVVRTSRHVDPETVLLLMEARKPADGS